MELLGYLWRLILLFITIRFVWVSYAQIYYIKSIAHHPNSGELIDNLWGFDKMMVYFWKWRIKDMVYDKLLYNRKTDYGSLPRCPKCNSQIIISGTICYPEEGMVVECSKVSCDFEFELRTNYRKDIMKEILIEAFKTWSKVDD